MARTVFTTITPLPAGITRATVLETLHDHLEMIDLNPSHTSRTPIASPPEATPEEYHCTWYQIVDLVSYLPGYKGKIAFKVCFHDLANGMQNHVYAPMGLDIKEKWTLGGNEPGEPIMPAEIGIGAPVSGLYLREDVEMKCNFLMTRFVRNTLKDSLKTLVARLVVKAQLQEAREANKRLDYGSPPNSPPNSPPMSPPSTAGLDGRFERSHQNRESTQTYVSEMDGSQRSWGTKSEGWRHPVEVRSDNEKYAPVELPS